MLCSRCREGQEGCVRDPSWRPYVARLVLVIHHACLTDPRRVSLSGLSYSQIAQQIGISEQRVVDSAFPSLPVVRSSRADVVTVSPSALSLPLVSLSSSLAFIPRSMSPSPISLYWCCGPHDRRVQLACERARYQVSRASCFSVLVVVPILICRPVAPFGLCTHSCLSAADRGRRSLQSCTVSVYPASTTLVSVSLRAMNVALTCSIPLLYPRRNAQVLELCETERGYITCTSSLQLKDSSIHLNLGRSKRQYWRRGVLMETTLGHLVVDIS